MNNPLPGPESQRPFIDKIRQINEARGENPAYHISTFGCQMNAHDSEKIAAMLADMGYAPAAGEESADVVVYNTCCVRENAENRVYGNLGILKHLRDKGRRFKVVLCGCMTQQGYIVEKIRREYRNVDVILGTFNLFRLPELLWMNMESGDMIIDIWEDRGEFRDFELPYVPDKPFKASVNIMTGCNNFCSYCIVPYVRGRERSRPMAGVLAETEKLAAGGVKEVLLLGQNVNSYGEGFALLLRRVSEIPGIERVRFMTSHPKDLSGGLIAEIAANPKICRHIHLPFQSGSDRVLGLMNRRYTKARYLELVEKIKREIPGAAITADIIVGFPTETEADFEDTLDVVRRAGFSGAYTFLYSKRKGTPAAEMDGQVDAQTAKERFSRLLETLNPLVGAEMARLEGTEQIILAEDYKDGTLTGRTDGNALTHFKGGPGLIGGFVRVKITESKTFYCIGEMLK